MEEEASIPRETGAFDRLPPNVIEHILYVADANVFASLALLNRQWRRISELSSLYAYQLSKCPSFTWTRGATPAPSETDGLADLKRQFLEETRRNAFDVFLRPRRTLVRLISSSMSSSTAFPQGEVFRFSFSAYGQLVLCISSSRIVVLDVTKEPVAVRYELQTRRRPLGATIQDDGSLLAVLSSTHRVNIYRLLNDEVKHFQTITLNDSPRDLTFSPMGSVLALSFEDCIEVYAVGEEVLSTERRAARCPRVDALSFSRDGTMLLGSPVGNDQGGIVTITAPFYTDIGIDASPQELQMRMWTAQILFPETTPNFTHACLINGHEEADDSWILGYDSALAAFRAIKVNNVDYGGVYFASPFLADELRETLPIMLPSTDNAGELAALGFQDSEIWIYGVPARLDVTPPIPEGQDANDSHFCGNHHSEGQLVPRDNRAQLEKIIQQPKKALIRGRRITDMHGVTSARWVRCTASSHPRRRLVAVAPGGVRPQVLGEEDIPVDGGRLLILDFERSTTNGEEIELDIEVGETAPAMLTEPDSSLDTEVELERRRTRLHRGDTDPTSLTGLVHRPSHAITRENRRTASQHAFSHLNRSSSALATFPDGPTRGDVVDIPYDNTQPRSQDTLHRAATAAASTRGRYDPRYRNNSGRRQIPHESDADNWVPPPPPYTREADQPLPEDLQTALLPSRSVNAQNQTNGTAQPVQRAQTARVARQPSSDRPRPQSAFLQRLGSITSNRRSSRGRRDSFSAAGETPGLERTYPDISQAPHIPHQYLTNHDTTVQNYHAWPIRSDMRNASIPNLPVATNHLRSLQPLPTLTLHPAEQPAQQEQATLGATLLGEDYLSYSVSSPNLLHIPQPSGNALDLTEEDEEAQIPARQRSFRRRVSTEPNSLPPPANEEWRRRIEDWNERTIRERSRKRRNKCTVM
ncbi:F-box domain protein [Penicillium brasilianum]|uniref:F-box domain protein n=1 Tax=Penicillium brasilianum TaxID=104259 RepID=A0A1S9RC71_PENBI|nr:F-box domain protein [Penicillium brasilianum]